MPDPTPNGPGNTVLTEAQLQRIAAERGLKLPPVGVRPVVQVTYWSERKEVAHV